jgi:23S rRNA (uracil1939-C5)-methyltransferase
MAWSCRIVPAAATGMSSSRAMPASPVVECPHATACGACSLLGVPLADQLAEKRMILRDALWAHEDLRGFEPLRTLPSPLQEGYRNRAKMAFDPNGKDGPSLGYFRPRSRHVFDAIECRVLVPEILDTVERLRALFRSPKLTPSALRFIDLRCGSDPRRQHLTLVLGSKDARLPIVAIREACRHVTGIGVNLNPGSGSQVIKGPVENVWGEEFVRFELDHATLVVSAASFFQVNLGMLRRIHERLAAFLGEGGVLADLYAGVGTHGIELHERFERVICVEGVRAAVRDCRSSIAASRAHNVAVMSAPVERSVARLHVERPDVIVMNPSREGVEPEVLKSIGSGPAQRLAYLSCNPITLARDLAILLDNGFGIASVEPLDMMPQTLQVEALALLERVAAPPRPERLSPRGRSPRGR